jgi:hypothetical protein
MGRSPATTSQITSSVDGLMHLACGARSASAVEQRRTAGSGDRHWRSTDWSFSCESVDGTHSLLMNSPVGTAIFFPLGVATVADRDMLDAVSSEQGEEDPYLAALAGISLSAQ